MRRGLAKTEMPVVVIVNGMQLNKHDGGIYRSLLFSRDRDSNALLSWSSVSYDGFK